MGREHLNLFKFLGSNSAQRGEIVPKFGICGDSPKSLIEALEIQRSSDNKTCEGGKESGDPEIYTKKWGGSGRTLTAKTKSA